mgnify:CR=1 FL=1
MAYSRIRFEIQNSATMTLVHLSEEQCERVVAIFSRRGAFRRFKDFLDECGKLQEWYAYEELTVLEALKQWLKDNDIDYVDDRPLSVEAQRIAALQR